MSFAVALITAIVTLDPLRVWPGLPGGGRNERLRLAALGAALVTGVLAIVAALADPILDSLEISDPTARIAAGVAVVVIGVRDAFAAPAAVDPALPGWRAALVPVAVPHLFTPGISLLAVSASADLGVGEAILAVMIAMAVVVGLALWPAPGPAGARAARAGQVLLAGLAIAMGGSLMVDGVLDI